MIPISFDTASVPAKTHAPFIVLEGTDGSGVSTQTELLARALRRQSIPVFATKQPSDGPVGAMIRLLLAKRLRTREEVHLTPQSQAEILALYFAADRIDLYYNTIRPKLSTGITVLCDRYHLSTYAYQGPDVEDEDWLEAINAKVTKPDLTIFLKVDTKTCLERIQHSRPGHLELFETEATLERVQRAYDRSIKRLQQQGDALVIVDGDQPSEEVHAAVLAAVRSQTSR